MKLSNMKIFTKILLGFSVVLVVAIATILFLVNELRHSSNLMQELYTSFSLSNKAYDAENDINLFDENLQKIIFALEKGDASKASEFINKLIGFDTSFNNNLNEIKKLVTDEKGKEFVAQGESQYKGLIDLETAIIKLIKTRDFSSAIKKINDAQQSRDELKQSIYFVKVRAKLIADEALSIMLKTISNSIIFSLMVSLVLIAAVIFTAIFLMRQIVRPILTLSTVANSIQHGKLNIKTGMTRRDEIGMLSGAFDNMTGRLSDLYANLELKVQQRTEELLATTSKLEEAKRIADRDMNLAIAVQAALYPETAPKTQKWDTAYCFRPMSGVSGDMYDFFIEDGELTGTTLCDISGHGISSSLIAMIARSVIYRTFMNNKKLPLNKIMDNINKELIAEIGNVDNYLTGILLRFNEDMIEYVNAGHADLLIKTAKTGGRVAKVTHIDHDFKGGFIGLAAMEKPYEQVQFRVAKEDVLLLYSDGLTDSTNTGGKEYGIEGIIKSFSAAPQNGSAKEILNAILDDFNRYTNNTVSDDVSIVVAKYF